MTGLLAFTPFQVVLDGLGAFLAWIYSYVNNYGVAIIIFTVIIRAILVPLGIKQVKGMMAMQQLAPKMKEIQKKYKGDKQKSQEETMKLYQEHGVNPLASCLPLLLQMPIFICLYAVLRPPLPGTDNHYPENSALYEAVVVNHDAQFLGMNLLCTPSQSGDGAVVVPDPNSDGESEQLTLDCGATPLSRIPYFVFLLMMIGSTYFQSRQMQKASPTPAAKQQQTIMRIMPLFFGLIGWSFPAGLIVYWTTSNSWQVGQQYILLKRLKANGGATAIPAKGSVKTVEKPGSGGKSAGSKASPAKGKPGAKPNAGKSAKPVKKGFMAKMVEQAEADRARKLNEAEQQPDGSKKKKTTDEGGSDDDGGS